MRKRVLNSTHLAFLVVALSIAVLTRVAGAFDCIDAAVSSMRSDERILAELKQAD